MIVRIETKRKFKHDYNENNSLGDKDEENNKIINNPTFVAMIDVVFTDGQRKTCTGSIIHENVVITAAHCFKTNIKKIWPELTASFVVIGNKIMFESGYEQYIPIERILIHPKFKKWTADLALVFTFASMTNDKPGSIIPLAGEKTTIHVDYNLTVLTWGHTAPDELSDNGYSCNSDEDPSRSGCRPEILRNKQVTPEKIVRTVEEKPTPDEEKVETEPEPEITTATTTLSELQELHNLYDEEIHVTRASHTTRSKEHKKRNHRKHPEKHLDRSRRDHNTKKSANQQSTKVISRYLESIDQDKGVDENLEEVDENVDKTPLTVLPRVFHFKSSYGIWRRDMGDQQNQLFIESFSFISLQKCKHLIDMDTQEEVNITKNDDTICYSSTGMHITDADSGAPAIRKGKLVAVTVAGTKYESEHAAIGMKMSCYCSWIADNLPESDTKLNCCKNCCEVKHKETVKPHGYKFRNRYLL